MKKKYEKPVITIEEYVLDTAIAAGCNTIVTLGPEAGVQPDGKYHEVCDEYIQVLSVDTSTSSGPWYEGSCSCYLSSGNGTMLTS